MSNVVLKKCMIHAGVGPDVAAAARELAKAARLNAEAILAIAEALKTNSTAALHVDGDHNMSSQVYEYGTPWRGEGFYPAPEAAVVTEGV